LINIGFFDEDERVELLEGVLVYMSPINPLHSNAVDLLTEAFGAIVTRGITRVRRQGPISIPEAGSEPEPDLIIFRVSGVDFALRHPSPNEVLLVMEVADSSLAHDRSHKATLYAQAGIPDYWIWNLVDNVLEVYRDPHTPSSGDALYQTKLTYHRGESLAPLAFPDFEVEVDNILPPAANEA
jgi:Uma2 family endonuclease